MITVVIGQPFSGKSRFAGELAWEQGGLVIDANDFLCEPDTHASAPYTMLDFLRRDAWIVEAISKVRALMPVPIIITGTYYTRRSRRELVRSLREVDEHIQCVWMNTPWEVCVRRGADAGVDITHWKLDFRRPNTGDGWESIIMKTMY